MDIESKSRTEIGGCDGSVNGDAAQKGQTAPRALRIGRVVVADDKQEIRSALRLLVEEGAGGRVEAEADDGASLLALLEQLSCGEDDPAEPYLVESEASSTQVNGYSRQSSPCILLLDWELPGPSPEALLAKVRALAPELRVVALSSRPESEAEALAAGADAFVSKAKPPECLLNALLLEASGRGERGELNQAAEGTLPDDARQEDSKEDG
jgi:CheY-like chemotaxis protein